MQRRGKSPCARLPEPPQVNNTMTHPHTTLPRRLLTSLLMTGLGLLATLNAWADGARRMPAAVPPAYTQECAACHTAYPPALLPARSWQRIMSGLDRHYGTDASLDAATVQQLSQWLQTHAATSSRVGRRPRHRIASPARSGSNASTTKSSPRCGACPASRAPPTAPPATAAPIAATSTTTGCDCRPA